MKSKKQTHAKKDSVDSPTDLMQQVLRTQAELDNFRKRSEQERLSLIKYANTNLVSDILPVLDNFKRAAVHAPETSDAHILNWITGIKAIEKQLEDVLRQSGLQEIEVHIGDQFNHNLHEAISHDASEAPEDTILEVRESGYMFNEKVLRPVKVRVSAGPHEHVDTPPESTAD